MDKSPDLINVKKSDYIRKIHNFLGPNFEKIENYFSVELEKDLESYRALISQNFKNSLPNDVMTDMHLPYSISDFYGTFKCHKENEPIRGIVTSYNSIVCNSEDFSKTIWEPIVAECTYAVRNLKEFKQKFNQNKIKFNQNEYKVVSVDVINMFNNVNVPRVISYILDKIYTQPRKFFKFKNENGVYLPMPTREKLNCFLLDTFQKYLIFRSPIGVYKQNSGLGMGSSI